MISKKIFIIQLTLVLVLSVLSIPIYAQAKLSLKDCLHFALNNNHDLRIARYNVEIYQKRIVEQYGSYLPQINLSGEFDDNLQLTTQLMPAEMMGGEPGTYIPVKFGNKYSMSGGVQLTQKIFDPQSIALIKSARLSKSMSELTAEQTNEQIQYTVGLIYYQTLVIQMQYQALKSTLSASEQSLKSMELKRANGIVKKVDVDKIRVSFNNTKSQLETIELNYIQSLNNLRLTMGMSLDSAILLTDTVTDQWLRISSRDTLPEFRLMDVYDYQLNMANKSLVRLDRKAKIAAFLPTLSFFGNYNYNAMRQEFTFLDAHQDWYPGSGIGFKLSIPVFDGLQRSSKLAQANLNLKIADEKLLFSEQSIKLNISNYRIQLKKTLDNIYLEKENLELAGTVFKNTQLEYQQGTGSALDLIQSESAYVVAQNTYFNKLLDLCIARFDLEKAKGNLINFLNQ